MPYTYIVECSDGTYYTGWATDLEKRLKAHNTGTGARYTRGRAPVKLVYAEWQPDKTASQRREYEIKRLSRRQKENLVEKNRTYTAERLSLPKEKRDKI